MIYGGSPTEHLRSLTLSIVENLRAKNRCLYLNSPQMVECVRPYLLAASIDVDHEIEKGALILSSDQSQIINRRFDSKRMLQMLTETINKALMDGYKGLFATGDMTWEFGGDYDFDTLIEYERELETVFQNYPTFSGVCQYHEDTLPVHFIRGALKSHQAAYINETLSRMNPFYVAPESPVDEIPSAKDLDLSYLRALLSRA